MNEPVDKMNDYERFNAIENEALKLTDLLNGLYGVHGESFRTRSVREQDSVLWLAHDLADRIRLIAGGGQL
jgi:hypothetical protein